MVMQKQKVLCTRKCGWCNVDNLINTIRRHCNYPAASICYYPPLFLEGFPENKYRVNDSSQIVR